jgi:glucokinase
VACASAAALADLDLVAVAGGLAVAAGPLLLDPARAALARHARLDFTRDCSMVAATLAGDAGLVGAGVIGFAALDRATH